MDWKKILSLDSKKILTILILLLLFSFPGALQLITEPMKCLSGGCNLLIGLPLPYMDVSWNTSGALIMPNLNFVALLIDIITFYLVTVILFYLLGGGKKNVPDSNY